MRWQTWLGIGLLAAGLLGHLLAAQALGGYYIAYRDHIAGFVLLTAIAAAITAAIGSRFWRGRHEITVLIVGIVQTIFGIFVYVNRFNIH